MLGLDAPAALPPLLLSSQLPQRSRHEARQKRRPPATLTRNPKPAALQHSRFVLTLQRAAARRAVQRVPRDVLLRLLRHHSRKASDRIEPRSRHAGRLPSRSCLAIFASPKVKDCAASLKSEIARILQHHGMRRCAQCAWFQECLIPRHLRAINHIDVL